jgi:hypothetical protein
MQVKVVNVYLELEFNTFSIAYIFLKEDWVNP